MAALGIAAPSLACTPSPALWQRTAGHGALTPIVVRVQQKVGTQACAHYCWRPRNDERRRGDRIRCAAAAQSAGADFPSESSEVLENAGNLQQQEEPGKSATSFWKNWQMNAGELREKVAKLGRAGLLAYGLFNGITYTSFFVVAFLGFEKSTGQNPATNLKACLGVVISMWTGNNFTRPLRVAGAAALAPLMDKVLKKTQTSLKLQDEGSAFLVLVTSFIALCFSIVGLLILSRLGR